MGEMTSYDRVAFRVCMLYHIALHRIELVHHGTPREARPKKVVATLVGLALVQS